MKKTVLMMLVMMVAFIGSTFAQDSKIETGVIAFQQSDWKKAIDALDEGLKDPGMLKPKNLPRGYYHRGMARMRYMGQLAQGGGEMTEEKGQQLQDLLMGAFDDFKKARSTDDGKWGKKVDDALTMMNVSFLQAGIAGFNAINEQKLKGQERIDAFKEVVDVFGYAIEINPKNYVPFDLRAQAELGSGDTTAAMKDFQEAAKLAEGNTHNRPDLLIGYIYYRMATIQRYQSNNIDGALASVDKGKKMLDVEFAKMSNLKTEKPEEYAKVQEQYNGIKEDLDKFELDLLLNAPEKLEQAIQKFEKAVAAEPKNYVLHVAYAQLLDKVGKFDEAIAVYEKASAIEPNNQLAWFNMGAMYVNAGANLYKEANAENDVKKAQELQDKAKGYFQKGLPALKKAQEIEPCDRDILKTLMQIAINLELTDDYAAYKAKLKECEG